MSQGRIFPLLAPQEIPPGGARTVRILDQSGTGFQHPLMPPKGRSIAATPPS